jgi:hypothetical protein
MSSGEIWINDIQLYIGKSSSEGDRKKAFRLKLSKEKENKSLENIKKCRESDEKRDICPQSVRHVSTRDQSIEIRDQRLDNKGVVKKTTLVFPSILDTDAFRSAWNEWRLYRKERRITTTERTFFAQLSKLEKFGHDDAIQAIKDSISNGWMGLFPKKTRYTDDDYKINNTSDDIFE